MSTSDQLVQIGYFDNVTDAYVALGALRDAGIPCQVIDGLAALYTPIGTPVSGARILVFQRDLERARQILQRDT